MARTLLYGEQGHKIDIDQSRPVCLGSRHFGKCHRKTQPQPPHKKPPMEKHWPQFAVFLSLRVRYVARGRGHTFLCSDSGVGKRSELRNHRGKHLHEQLLTAEMLSGTMIASLTESRSTL